MTAWLGHFSNLLCLQVFSYVFPESILILNTDTSVFSTYWYWYLISILQIEYWYRYFSIWKSYWILNTSIFISIIAHMFSIFQSSLVCLNHEPLQKDFFKYFAAQTGFEPGSPILGLAFILWGMISELIHKPNCF